MSDTSNGVLVVMSNCASPSVDLVVFEGTENASSFGMNFECRRREKEGEGIPYVLPLEVLGSPLHVFH